MAPPPLLLDGSTGEGGGQLVRIAVALSAVTGRAIKVVNIRANRTKSRPVGKRGSVQVTGGGLKNQHVAAIKYLADASGASTTGLTVGSSTLTFTPALPPTSLQARTLTITPESPASSAPLILQALLPFLLFAGGAPVDVEIRGGTNTSHSMSFEYVDQVLLPALEERFGVRVKRELRARGWGGWASRPGDGGCVWARIYPVQKGASLVPWPVVRNLSDPRNLEVRSVDISLIVPHRLQGPLQTALAADLSSAFPSADISFEILEDSGHPSRIYLLLVATSPTGLRWGRDVLHEPSKKPSNPDVLAAALSRQAVKQLFEEVEGGGEVDVYLQDQLVCFQALAAGRTSVVRQGGDVDEAGGAMDAVDTEGVTGEVHGPFGNGSMHARTARWVAAKLLPAVRFFEGGNIVEGAGVKFGEDSASGQSGTVAD